MAPLAPGAVHPGGGRRRRAAGPALRLAPRVPGHPGAGFGPASGVGRLTAPRRGPARGATPEPGRPWRRWRPGRSARGGVAVLLGSRGVILPGLALPLAPDAWRPRAGPCRWCRTPDGPARRRANTERVPHVPGQKCSPCSRLRTPNSGLYRACPPAPSPPASLPARVLAPGRNRALGPAPPGQPGPARAPRLSPWPVAAPAAPFRAPAPRLAPRLPQGRAEPCAGRPGLAARARAG